MAIQDVVNIQITIESSRITRAGFGTLLVASEHSAWPERVRSYSSPAAAAEDFLTSSDQYKAINIAFSQDLSPTAVKVGRILGAVAQKTTFSALADLAGSLGGKYFTLNSANDATSYYVWFDVDNGSSDPAPGGTGIEVDISAGDSALTVAIAAAAAINALGDFGAPVPTTADFVVTNAATGPTTASADVDTGFGVVTDEFGSDADADLTASLTAIGDEDDDYYALALTSRFKADILEAAAFIESRRKIFLASNEDSDVLTTASTDVATALKALNYARTAYLYSGASEVFPEIGWAGKMLPREPGTSTWALKTIVGVADDSSLTGTERNNLKSKNANFYVSELGRSITQGANGGGNVADGEFIDVIRGIDWMQARMTEGVFLVLAQNDKVPYTDDGISQIVNPIREILSLAEERTILSTELDADGNIVTPAFEISVPLSSSIGSATKATRTLIDVSFKGHLAGAIHIVDPVIGRVSV